MTEWSAAFDAVMEENFRRIAGDLDTALQTHTNSNGLFDERVASSHLDGHLLNVSLANCGVVRYTASLSAFDARALADADGVGLVAVGLSWATREIREALSHHEG